MEAKNIRKETWRPIKGYEGFYLVSDQGQVKSIKREVRANTTGKRIVNERILSPGKTKSGYLQIVLLKHGHRKTLLIHRIVAEAFISNPEKLSIINHKDENKENNFVENLEWCTQQYNANYGTGAKRCGIQKYKKVFMFEVGTKKLVNTFTSAKEAEAQTGISRKQISAVCTKVHKTAGGFYWSFAREADNER